MDDNCLRAGTESRVPVWWRSLRWFHELVGSGDREGCVEQTAWYARFISLTYSWRTMSVRMLGCFCGILRRALVYHRQHGACIPQRSAHYRGVSRNAKVSALNSSGDDFQTEFKISGAHEGVGELAFDGLDRLLMERCSYCVPLNEMGAGERAAA